MERKEMGGNMDMTFQVKKGISECPKTFITQMQKQTTMSWHTKSTYKTILKVNHNNLKGY